MELSLKKKMYNNFKPKQDNIMLKVKSFCLIIFSLLFVLSCSKDDDENELLVSMTVDGQEFTTESVQGTDTGIGEYIITASGMMDETTVSIDFIIILDEAEKKQLDLGPGGDADINVSIGEDQVYSTTTTGSSGSLTITSKSNNRLEGTFEFTAYSLTIDPEQENISVSDGIFKASFISF